MGGPGPSVDGWAADAGLKARRLGGCSSRLALPPEAAEDAAPTLPREEQFICGTD